MGGNSIEAVVFDLDGTLIDSAPDLRTAVNRMLADRGRRGLGLGAVTAMVGDGVHKLVERALAATGKETPTDGEIARATRRFIDFYEGHGADLTRAYAGAVEALKCLRDEGYALGICTNKPHRATCGILGALDLEGYFSAVLGGDSLDGVRKPDPRHLLAVLERLGATRGNAVMVGDTENDVAAARGAGVPVIAVAFGYAKVPAAELGADAVIGHFDELPDAIRRLS